MKSWPKFLILLLISTIPLFQACSGGAGAWEGTVTDSAGITVVHNTDTPIWRPGEEWTVTEELRIGAVAGEPEYQFGTLGFMDLDPEGNIYAADVQAQEVRVFDSQGEFVRTIGSPGSGPGELALGAAFVFVDPAGEVVVPDLGNQRVNRYSASGEPLGSFPIQLQQGIPRIFAMDPSGRLLAQLQGVAIQGIAALEEGDPIVAYDTLGSVVDTLAMLPKGQTREVSGDQVRGRIFAPEPVWDLDDTGSVYYAMSDRYKIFVNGPGGELIRIITRDIEPKPVGEADKEAILDLLRQQYAQLGASPAQIQQALQVLYFADFYPVFGQFFVGPQGTLWAQRIRTAQDMASETEGGTPFDPQDIGAPEWEVFDAEGRYLGVVDFPEGFSPRRVKGEDIYGVWRDEYDVQYIVRLRVNADPA
jgi:hypothetical protein